MDMRKSKIVCTIGPASWSRGMISSLIKKGWMLHGLISRMATMNLTGRS